MRLRMLIAALVTNAGMIAWSVPGHTEPQKIPTSEDLMRNARMDACIKNLQKDDKSLKNYWQKHCGLAQVDRELAAEGPDQPVALLGNLFSSRVSADAEGDGACRDAVTPVASTNQCGLGTKTLYQNLQSGAAMKIRLPGNKCGTFIPILLTNKTDFACNAVQSRIACVDISHDDKTDRTSIRLSTRRDKNAEFTTIEFGANELAQVNGRLSDLIQHPQFTMIPAMAGSEPVAKTILSATQQKQQSCQQHTQHSAAECARIARFQADAFMQEAIRRYRNPKHDSPPDAIVKDGKDIVAFLKSKGINQVEEKWILFLAIAKNEVGLKVDDNDSVLSTYDPIYGVSDAILDNSGLSFGAHQIDLGANEGSEVALFWAVIDAYKAQHPDPILAAANAAQDCVDLPLRLMTVGALGLTYQATPRMTPAMRSREGADEYNRRLLDWLDEETRTTAAKPGLFKKSMITRVLFSDLKNQNGSGKLVEKLASQMTAQGVDLDSCQDVTATENKLLDALIWQDPVTKTKRTDYADRYEHVRDIVRHRAVRQGLSGCS